MVSVSSRPAGRGNPLPGPRRLTYAEPVTAAVPHVLLDDVGKAIVEQLQQDGRRSYVTIARAVGLSEAAVRQRVARLQEAGVIQVVAVTDPLHLGFQHGKAHLVTPATP